MKESIYRDTIDESRKAIKRTLAGIASRRELERAADLCDSALAEEPPVQLPQKPELDMKDPKTVFAVFLCLGIMAVIGLVTLRGLVYIIAL